MLYLAKNQISLLLGKQKWVICEIVSVSAPASIYFNGCVNDFSPIFTESWLYFIGEIICSSIIHMFGSPNIFLINAHGLPSTRIIIIWFGFKKFCWWRENGQDGVFPFKFMFCGLVEVHTLKSLLTRTLLLGIPSEWNFLLPWELN